MPWKRFFCGKEKIILSPYQENIRLASENIPISVRIIDIRTQETWNICS